MDPIATVASLGALFLAGANVAIFCIVKFNDLAHLQKSQEEIKILLRELDTKLEKNGERIATIEGKCKANHG